MKKKSVAQGRLHVESCLHEVIAMLLFSVYAVMKNVYA